MTLPALLDQPIKAKVDTGARTSALHVFDLEEYWQDDRPWVRFEIHPHQRSTAGAIAAEAPLVEKRSVRSSSGRAQLRPVIRTDLQLGDLRWPIELTLTSRDQMGFRMLLGRTAIRRRFVVDPGRSYLAGDRPPRSS